MRARTTSRRRGMVMAIVALALTFAAAAPASADPPGANGTVKIDGRPFDSHPDNQPHVGCEFEVDFYGFDKGNFTAEVIFTIHPPSGKPAVLLQDRVFVGQDKAGGGTDLDAEREYDLSDELAPYKAHPKQGYHVKLTVKAPGVGGKIATKHKVFWVQRCKTDCPPPPPYYS